MTNGTIVMLALTASLTVTWVADAVRDVLVARAEASARREGK